MKKNDDLLIAELREEFEKLDLAEVDIFWIHPEYLREILNGFKKCLQRCPYVNSKSIILRGRRPGDSKTTKSTLFSRVFAWTQPKETHDGRLMVEIVFEDTFKSKSVPMWLTNGCKRKWSVFYDINGLVCHEFGHILHLYFLAKCHYSKLGQIISEENYGIFYAD